MFPLSFLGYNEVFLKFAQDIGSWNWWLGSIFGRNDEHSGTSWTCIYWGVSKFVLNDPSLSKSYRKKKKMSIHPSRTRCSGDLSPRRCFLAIRRWLPPPNITAAGSHLLWFCLLASTTRRCPPPPADALRDDDPRAHSLRWRSDNALVSGLHESASNPFSMPGDLTYIEPAHNPVCETRR